MVLVPEDLPAPRTRREGFPWTVGCAPMQGDNPRISVVVPSFNQELFLEETIRSVLLQGHCDTELIVIDGGSTDGTVDLLRRYSKFLAYWHSEPDRGQSHAINRGLAKVTGKLIGWQNSDDLYLPGAFSALCRKYGECPESDVYYGDWLTIDESSVELNKWLAPALFDVRFMPPYTCLSNQSSFFSHRIINSGFIREDLHLCMDIDCFWRLALAKNTFEKVDCVLGAIRLHGNTKTQKITQVRSKELFDIYLPIIARDDIPKEARNGLLAALYGCLATEFRPECRQIFLAHASALSVLGELPRGLALRRAVARMGEGPMKLARGLKFLRRNQ